VEVQGRDSIYHMGQFEPDRTHERTHVRGRHDLTLASRVCALALMLPVAHLRLGCDVAMRERRLGDVFGCAAGSVGVRGGVAGACGRALPLGVVRCGVELVRRVKPISQWVAG
jgi:hypothetical protein